MSAKVSKETLYDFLDALCKASLIKRVYRYVLSGKPILQGLSRYYIAGLEAGLIKKVAANFKTMSH